MMARASLYVVVEVVRHLAGKEKKVNQLVKGALPSIKGKINCKFLSEVNSNGGDGSQ